ncbi:hypothetical protein OTU49_008477, partial [Cherax quadricarinatus]
MFKRFHQGGELSSLSDKSLWPATTEKLPSTQSSPENNTRSPSLQFLAICNYIPNKFSSASFLRSTFSGIVRTLNTTHTLERLLRSTQLQSTDDLKFLGTHNTK